MELRDAVDARQSIKRYDPTHEITDAELRRLFEVTVLSPSSFNLQHWRFVAVRDKETKAKLRQACFGQEQAETASAVVVILGKLDAYRDAPMIYADAPQNVQDTLLPMIEGAYAKNETVQREEAIRSCSLAAMTLMLAAQDMGYATCPMIGFDPKAVTELMGIPQNHFPALIVTVGKAAGGDRSRSSRLPLSEVVRLEHCTGQSLG